MLPSSVDKIDQRPDANTLPSSGMIWLPRKHPPLHLPLPSIETNHRLIVSHQGLRSHSTRGNERVPLLGKFVALHDQRRVRPRDGYRLCAPRTETFSICL